MFTTYSLVNMLILLYYVDMKKVIISLFLVLFFIACNGAGGSQETVKLRKAIFDKYETVYMRLNNIKSISIETGVNGIAGLNGTVSYYIPKEQPTNQNFRRLGVKIEKDRITTDFIMLVNMSANTAITETVIFGGKYQFILNEKGNRNVGVNEFAALVEWAGSNELAMTIGTSFYPHLLPQFIILE